MQISNIIRDINNLLDDFSFEFPKRQINNFKSFIKGLIGSESKTINGISNSLFCHKNQSSINRFVNGSSKLKNRLKGKILERALKSVDRRRRTYAIVDNSLVEKFGKKMFAVVKLYDSTKEKYIRGHDIVTLNMSNGNFSTMVDYAIYLKKEFCKRNNRLFKKKTEMARDMFLSFNKTKIKTHALGDSFYGNRTVILPLRKLGIDYTFRVKSNLIIILNNKEKSKIRLDEYFKNKKKRYRTINGEKCFFARAWLNFQTIGWHTVVCFRKEDEKEWKYIVSPKKKIKTRTMIKNYSRRQDIEVFYRDSKQNLGLNKYQLESEEGINMWFTYVGIAHTILAVIKASLKKNHPDITIGKLCECFKRNKIINLIIEVVKLSKKGFDMGYIIKELKLGIP